MNKVHECPGTRHFERGINGNMTRMRLTYGSRGATIQWDAVKVFSLCGLNRLSWYHSPQIQSRTGIRGLEYMRCSWNRYCRVPGTPLDESYFCAPPASASYRRSLIFCALGGLHCNRGKTDANWDRQTTIPSVICSSE